jgi:hypothetical protein
MYLEEMPNADFCRKRYNAPLDHEFFERSLQFPLLLILDYILSYHLDHKVLSEIIGPP